MTIIRDGEDYLIYQNGQYIGLFDESNIKLIDHLSNLFDIEITEEIDFD